MQKPRMAVTALLVAACALVIAACGSDVGQSDVSGPSQTSWSASPTTGVGVADAHQLSAGAWSALPRAPIPPRVWPSLVWTGDELLVWGGEAGPGGLTLYADGAAYNPTTNTWRLLSAGPLSGRVAPAAVWTGTEMILWGGYDDTTGNGVRATADGAAYNPASNTWRSLPRSPLAPRAHMQTAWTGTALLILGGMPGTTTAGSDPYVDGALYDPVSDRWTLVAPPEPLDRPNMSWVASVAAGTTVLAWSNWWEVHQLGPNQSSGSGGNEMYSYSPVTNTWTHLDTDPLALPNVRDAEWTGQVAYLRGVPINCGACSHPFVPQATAVYDPVGNSWSRLPPDPLRGDDLPFVWTGAALFSFNPSTTSGSTLGPGDASVYDPAGNSWRRTPSAPFGCTNGSDPVWTGSQVLLYCPRPETGDGADHDGLSSTVTGT